MCRLYLIVNVVIGEHSNINLNCTVAHDCKIGDFVSIFPQVAISGNVKIGSNATIGTGSAIIQKLKVGENVTIASMSNVTKNISDNSIALGNPIKIIKNKRITIMKNILILTNASQGLFNFRKELLDRVINEGNELYISTPDDNLEIIQKLKDMGCIIIETNLDRRGLNPVKDFLLFLKYFFLIKKRKPDIVLMYTIKPNLYGGIICRLLKVPYITTITGIGRLFQNKNLLSELVKKVYKFSLGKAKCVFFQNNANLEFFKTNKIINDNFKLINGSGVNLQKFSSETPLDKKNIVFLFVGRIMKEKGIEEYLEVSKLLKNKYENIEFKILGAYEEEVYKEKILEFEKLGIVKYLGTSNDVRKELEKVHCVVNPSWHEGMSNVLLEAGAMKRFLIASNIPGCKEIIINNKTGFIFEKNNVEDLKNSIEKFISLSNSEYKEYIDNSYEYIKNNFNRENIINEYIKVINS